jgi:CubicO group peptidase (beta-lactamase class C family)
VPARFPRPALLTLLATAVLAAVLAALAAAPAMATQKCYEPTRGWTSADPGAVGMDKGRLMRGLHAIQDRRAYAVRIYRHGCLVAEDTNAIFDADARYETWNITSSVIAMLAGRAMTLGLLQPQDPVGSLVERADADHGAITVRDLLERSSGLRADPDHVGGPDRVVEALADPVVHRPGTAFPDSPQGASLLGEVVARATGSDLQDFAQRELFGPLGITPARYGWARDPGGHPQGTFGLTMAADDVGRLGDLLRRGGRWDDVQLLAPGVVDAMLSPSRANPCFGWFVWLNSAKSCNGTGRRLTGGLPADMWELRGRQDQRVVVFPEADVEIVRLGLPGGDLRGGHDAAAWEQEVYGIVLDAITDERIGRTPPADAVVTDDPTRESSAPPPTPGPPGPPRARAMRVPTTVARVDRKRLTSVVLACPQRALRPCTGTATLDGTTHPSRFAATPGSTVRVHFRMRHLPRRGGEDRTMDVLDEDPAGGTDTTVVVRLTRKPRRSAPARKGARHRGGRHAHRR